MTKRRTRKQKEKARKNFKLYTFTEAKKLNFEANVKRQFTNKKLALSPAKTVAKNADYMVQDNYLASARKDITRSVIIASLILGTELVIYLVWH